MNQYYGYGDIFTQDMSVNPIGQVSVTNWAPQQTPAAVAAAQAAAQGTDMSGITGAVILGAVSLIAVGLFIWSGK